MTARALTCEAKVRVRELHLLADVGINPDEVGRRQPLVITVEIDLDTAPDAVGAIEETIDYRWIAAAAERLAVEHVPLIETFAYRLAAECLGWAKVIRARVSIDKPFAITRGVAGTEITLFRRK